jgi:hypothetical protein
LLSSVGRRVPHKPVFACADLEPPPCSTCITRGDENGRDPAPRQRRSLISSPASTYNLLDNITNSCYKGM